MAVFTSVAVFLFCAIALVVPSGFSAGAVLLLLASPALLWKRKTLNLQREDYFLIGVFLLYFLICTLINWFHHGASEEYDVPLRFLLVIPPFLLLRAYPPAPGALWGGVATGATSAGLFAGWEVMLTATSRAGGYTNPIQYGNISLLFGVLCLAGLGWAVSQPRAKLWTGFLLVGAALGLLGSIFSGSRGSWIALPICLFILYRYHGGRLSRRYVAIAFIAAIAIFATMYVIPRTGIKQRMQEVATETNGYFEAGNADTSIGARFEMWRTALVIIPEHPWLGWGKKGYMERKRQLIAAGKVAAFTADHTHVHNEYLDALVKRGLPGIIIVLGLYITPLVLFAQRVGKAETQVRPYAIAGVLLIVCYIFFGLTQAFLTHNNGVMILAFMLALLWSLSCGHERQK